MPRFRAAKDRKDCSVAFYLLPSRLGLYSKLSRWTSSKAVLARALLSPLTPSKKKELLEILVNRVKRSAIVFFIFVASFLFLRVDLDEGQGTEMHAARRGASQPVAAHLDR